MRYRSLRVRLAALAVAGATCVACGPTITVGTEEGPAGVAGDAPAVAVPDNGLGGAVGEPELSGPPPGGVGSAAGTPVGPVRGSSGSGSGSVGGGGGTGAGSGGAGSAGSGSTSGPVVNGPGVTATSIFLGIPYCNDCAAGNAALGAGGQDPGDTREYYQAAIEDVNGRGGVLGRRLVPVFHEVSVSDNIDVSQQEACETFTNDHKVAAIFMRGDVIYTCAQKAGVIVMGSGGSGPTFARFPHLFAPATIRLERLNYATAKAMVGAGWHKPEPKWPTGRIGLITWDSGEYRYAMEHGYLKGLRESGLKATDVRYVAIPQNANSVAESSAAISSAILAFQDQGIDHVFIGDGPAGIFTGAGLTFQFLQNAQTQGYLPRYGFNSNNSPGWDQLPPEQQVGMLAIDSFDNQKINDEGIALNPSRERCWELMRGHGRNVGDEQTANIALGACEIAWFAEAVFQRARNGTVLRDVIAAAESIGTAYRSPYTYGTRIRRGQHDGVYLFRSSRYDEACRCMRYTSAPYEP